MAESDSSFLVLSSRIADIKAYQYLMAFLLQMLTKTASFVLAIRSFEK